MLAEQVAESGRQVETGEASPSELRGLLARPASLGFAEL